MDPKLLEYYSRELGYIKEMGNEFALQYPKIAGRLGMAGAEVADPYVERLLEGFAFLTARIHLKMDAEFPRFSQRLLEMVYPNYLTPTPAMGVVELKPNQRQGSLMEGFQIPRGSLLRSHVPRGETVCAEFRSAHDVTLWPLQVEAIHFGGPPSDVSLAHQQWNRQVKSSLRIRLKLTEQVAFKQLDLDQLTFYIGADDILSSRLYELLAAHTCGALVCNGAHPPKITGILQAANISLPGYAEDEALIPYAARGFQGYRLLHEYFAFPQRYQFFTLKGLKPGLHKIEGDSVDLILLFDQQAAELEGNLTREHLALFCTPIINLFSKRADRIAITPDRYEYHVVIDRTKPLDYEVFSIEEVSGSHADRREEQAFRPFYTSIRGETGGYGAYFSARREPRVLSENARQYGPRTSYVGSELFISLVDQREAPFRSDLRELNVSALCSNRDLTLMIPLGMESDFTLAISSPIERIKVLKGLTRPRPSLANGDITWRLISHLGLNYLSLTDLDKEKGAAALRDLLRMYADLSDAHLNKQIDGIHSVALTPVTRRLPSRGPLVFGRGIDIAITVDEVQFAGISPIVFGMVIEQFLARHVAINTFIETSLHSIQRGLIHRWPARFGNRPVA